jgi:TonB family protein
MPNTHAEETMFTTLVESRAVRRRSVRGAAISVVLHSMIVAAAVAVTYPTAVEAHDSRDPLAPVVYVPAPPPIRETRQTAAAPFTSRPAAPEIPAIHIPAPTITPLSLPPIDNAGPMLPTDRVVIGGGPTPGGPAGGRSETFAPDAVLDAGVVDRVPHIIGNAAPPRYPDVLRQTGATGQVVVRFVVDTLGRAELGDLVVVEATHPLFASAVKSALFGYRFTPGEAAGRKVRTMVQVPFTFTLH